MENEDPLSTMDAHIPAPTYLQPNQQRNVDVGGNVDWRHDSPLTINTSDVDIVAPTLPCETTTTNPPPVRNESTEPRSPTLWFANFFGFGRKFATRQEDIQERHSDPEIIASPSPQSPILQSPTTNEAHTDAKLPAQAHWTVWHSLRLAFAMSSRDGLIRSACVTVDNGTRRRSRLWRIGSEEDLKKNAVRQEPKSILKKRPTTMTEKKEADTTSLLDSSTSYATISPSSPTYRPTSPCAIAIPTPTSPGSECSRQRSLFFDSTPPAVIPAYSPTKYNRRPERGFTYLRLTPKLREEIVEELNTFKREEMCVHSESAGMTAFH